MRKKVKIFELDRNYDNVRDKSYGRNYLIHTWIQEDNPKLWNYHGRQTGPSLEAMSVTGPLAGPSKWTFRWQKKVFQEENVLI